MPNNPELNLLYQKYQAARDYADRIYDEMQSAKKAHQEAREDRNRKQHIMTKHEGHYDTVWNQFHHLRNCNKARIETLRHEAEYADDTRRATIHKEIDELTQEINTARREAIRRASKAYKIAFHQADYFLDKARKRYEIAKERYERAEHYCKQCEDNYERAKAMYEAHTNQPPN